MTEEPLSELFLSDLIISSHEDFEVIDDLEAGFNEQFELIIRLSREYNGWTGEDMDDPKCAIEMIVSKENAFKLAQRLKTPLAQLHNRIAASVSPKWDDYDPFPEPSDIWYSFCQLRAFLEMNKCPYRTARKFAKGPQGRFNPWH